MRHLHLLVEGQTEENVVNRVIAPHIMSLDSSYLTYSIFTTKRSASGPAHKGGISSWPRLHRELKLLLRDSSTTVLTTLFDYYAFPSDAPGMSNRPVGSPYDRVRHVENAIAETIGDQRFLPHLTLHEIETWVLADCARLGEVMGDSARAIELLEIVKKEPSPELIDDGPATAPSKRILDMYPNFRKTTDGPSVISDVGLESIRLCCPHADEWLTKIETTLAPGG